MNIIKEHLQFRKQILYLTKTDLIKANRGAALGWLWLLIQPLLLLLVYWFVLRIGLRVDTAKGEPDFFPWLMTGMIAWFFMSAMLNKGTGAIKSYKYLVTKMKFPISTIPTFVTLSKLTIHLALLAIAISYLVFVEGVEVTVHWLQLPVVIAMMGLFFITWGLFAAPLAAISKDFHNLVKSVTRILFWLSGVIWSVRQLDIEWIQTLLIFNPITFFVEAYRKALLYGEWITEDLTALGGFLLVWLILAILAAFTFSRVRKEIVDVL